MIKRFFHFLLWLAFASNSFVGAGDVATFANMGFSEDGKFFLFGQYGYDDIHKHVYAQSIFVDIEQNDYTKDGFHQHTLPSQPQSGDNLDGAFFELIARLDTIRKQYNINYAKKGRIVYASSVMQESARTIINNSKESLKFRDFQGNRQFEVILTQERKNQASTFNIDFTITSLTNKTIQHYSVGHPDIERQVSEYQIDRIIVSPNGKALVFVVAMHMPTAKGSANVRYMVEAITIE